MLFVSLLFPLIYASVFYTWTPFMCGSYVARFDCVRRLTVSVSCSLDDKNGLLCVTYPVVVNHYLSFCFS